jgi:hypothetical protein
LKNNPTQTCTDFVNLNLRDLPTIAMINENIGRVFLPPHPILKIDSLQNIGYQKPSSIITFELAP